MTDILQRIYAVKAAVLEEEQEAEPYERVRTRALARKGERRGFVNCLRRGGGAANSAGGNSFIGALTTEIYLKRRYETVNALDDTWNPRQQRANRNGQYAKKLTFGSGTSGKNVTIVKDALGSTVTVGPAIVPTATPSGSPGPTATPT